MGLSRALADALTEARELLPLGHAWPRDPRSKMDLLLGGLSASRAGVEVRVEDMLVESDPRTTTQLIEQWEEAVGLPDECLPAPETLAERRGLVVSRMVGEGGGSRAFFIALAQALGYVVTITEGTSVPFRAGVGRCGESLGGELDWYTWTVNAPETTVRPAVCGVLRCGEPLASWGNELLECAIRRASPAHTLVRFAYGSGGGPGVTCWITILDESGAAVTFTLTGTALLALDEAGSPVQVPTVSGELDALDENGDAVALTITCTP